jgi:ubiquinone/menaquinone biosynthesis C-methylase UbiE
MMPFKFHDSETSKEKLKEIVCKRNIEEYSGNAAEVFDKLQDTTKHYLKFVDGNVRNLFEKIGRDNLKIMEIGCGSGLMTQYLFKYTKTSKIFCLDIANDILTILRNKLSEEDKKRAKFICGDATDYFKNTKERFDIICVHGALHHMIDYMDLIKIASEKLNKNGVFYIANEPLPKKYYNLYLIEIFANLDIAFYKHLGKNNTRFILQLGFAPINFIKPILNSKLIKHTKDRILHGRYLGDYDYAEYWRIDDKGLDINGIYSIFKDNNMRIVKSENFSYSRMKFLYDFGKSFNINRFFNLIAVKD